MRKSNFFAFGQLLPYWFSLCSIIMLAGFNQAQAQCTLGCNDLIQFSLDEDCYSELTPDHILENPNSCPGAKVVTVMGANGQPIPGSPWVSGDYLGQTLTVKVTHPASGNVCWGAIQVEDKLPPVLECESLELPCSALDYSPYDIGYPTVQENCDLYPNLEWNDVISNQNCVGPYSAIVQRTWTATDASGNSSTCVQQINFIKANLGDVDFPANLDDLDEPSLACPNTNTSPAYTGWPTIGGYAVGGFCDIIATYEDKTSSMCQGNLTIFRDWTVLDMCTGATTTQLQVIKVVDKAGPTLICPTDPEHQIVVLDYLSGPGHSNCLAVVKFPQIQITDNCSNYSKLKFTLSTQINGFTYSIPTNGGTLTIPLGTHTFIYKATDDCGNSNECEFEFTVIDKVPPVVACETLHTVALSSDVTLVNASTFDDGSYDECGEVRFEVSRMENPKCFKNNGTPFGEQAPFYCCDINNGPVMVTLRVYDVANNYNECMTLVEVVDKVAPTIWCPADIEVQCGMPYEPLDPMVHTATVKPNMSINPVFPFTYQIPIDINGLPNDAQIIDLNVFLDINHEYIDQLKIRLISPKGTKSSLFEGGACGIGKEDILVTFNDEGLPFNCSGAKPSISGDRRPQADLLSFFDGEGINSIVINQNQKNTWVLEVEDTAPLAGGKINEVQLMFTYGTGLALKPKVHDNTELCGLEVTWEDLDIADKCAGTTVRRVWTVEDISGHKKSCTQLITFFDDTPWDVTFPEDVTIDDCTDLNDLKNLGEVVHNGDCEFVAVSMMDKILTVVPDACYKIERTWILVDWCKYDKNASNNTKLGYPLPHPKNLKYRDDGDGYFEYIQTIKVNDKTAPKIFCPADITVFNMEVDCGPTFVDPDPVVALDCSPTLKYTVSIDFLNDGSVNVIKNTAKADGEYPNGVHRVHYKVEDGCNNFSTCSFLITVVDGKAPQASCKNINIDLMAMNGGGMAQITPQMVNLASTDNCTPEHKLIMSVTPSVFTCDELGLNDVTLSVTDEKGNTDICIAIVNIQDNMGVCPDSANGTISGLILDANMEAVENVEVSVANMPGFNMMTGTGGSFQFNGLPEGVGYVVNAEKNNDHLNGISTYDLLLIQKHLLGVKMFDTPYKMIAADVNKSKAITISDIIDLRKALLTISPFQNDSWRFVEEGYTFMNPNNPLQETWPEHISVKTLTAAGANITFTGIKIGDVSGDAQPNTLLGSEVRNVTNVLAFEADDADLEGGQTYAMAIRAKDFNDMEGFQFTMNFNANVLEFAGVEAGVLNGLTQDNFGMRFVDEGYLTASWHGKSTSLDEEEVLFTINFRAKQAANLSEMVQINSEILRAEAYSQADQLMDAELRFANANGITTEAKEFALYQNRPNPFRDETVIGFEIPTAGQATLTFTDISGKVLRVFQGDFARGYNEFRVNRHELQASGVIYYRLTSDDNAATRKMIIIE